MYNQGPSVGRINPTFTDPRDEQDHLEKSRMGQSVPPPYYPNAGYQIPRVNPIPSGYPNQPYGAPGAPQGQYVHQSYPGMAAYPQAAYDGQNGVTVQPTMFMTPTPPATPMPDYLGYSIFTLLCCCLPLGIAATVCSCNTRDANASGHRESAMRSSRSALILNNIAIIIGFGLIMTGTILLLYKNGVI
ncbi:synapse differentiation-inducing gene protein 1-like [Carassius auratus]|uniref:Synapse differentiation-inducing gene protein 1-like n=1 Tax=Carassius auratus TaxID=7957 RepID=A0A6P6QAR9_CARAU|nr:synapse differentiation-inducing gene protein 1-like [Carassius auratus]